MSDVKLGKKVIGEAKRDAIHLAVIPVVVGEKLSPGEHVGLKSNGMVGKVENPIGIIDPFLTSPVGLGDRVYLCLYQGTITGMRHHWQHPAFNPEMEKKVETVQDTTKSEAWVQDFCRNNDINYDHLIDASKNNGMSGDQDSGIRIEYDYLTILGNDGRGNLPPELRDHVSVIIGAAVTRRPTEYTCSC